MLPLGEAGAAGLTGAAFVPDAPHAAVSSPSPTTALPAPATKTRRLMPMSQVLSFADVTLASVPGQVVSAVVLALHVSTRR
jgi:hypothetical protein